VQRLPLGPHVSVIYMATFNKIIIIELNFRKRCPFKSLFLIVMCTTNVIITSSGFCRFLAKCMRDRKHYCLSFTASESVFGKIITIQEESKSGLKSVRECLLSFGAECFVFQVAI
jgi:hypothetical protein